MGHSTSQEAQSAGVRAYLHSLMQARSIPGLQIAVVRDGRIEFLDMLGFANVEHQAPVKQDSVFSINSMAKAFTGIAVMQLVEAGDLKLSAPIADYLDGLPESWRTIKVEHLARLTSGLPEMMVYTADSHVTLIGDGSEASAWNAVYAAPFEFSTDQRYSYSQTNYALLGKIITRLSGKPFTRFIAARQFSVAGMSHTDYFTDQDIVPNRADTYMNISVEGDPAGRIFKSHLNWPPVLRTAAGLHSTAEDLANWVIALQRGDLLRDAASMETLLTTVPLDDGKPGIWGIGWVFGRSAAGRVPAPGGGAKAQVVLYPDGLAVIVLTNLLGAFREHLAAVAADEVDLSFMDPIARYFRS